MQGTVLGANVGLSLRMNSDWLEVLFLFACFFFRINGYEIKYANVNKELNCRKEIRNQVHTKRPILKYMV